MEILKHSFIVFLPLVFIGCTETFDPGISSEPVLCLNSLITAGEPVSVKVSRTWTYNDVNGQENHSVDDAVVSVYANGELCDAEYIPREGDEIRILAQSRKYGRAEATVKVPEAVPVVAVDFVPEVLSKSTWENPRLVMTGRMSFNMRVALRIDDSRDSDNYFRLDVSGRLMPDEPDGYVASHCPYSYYTPGEFDYNTEPIFKEHVGVFESVMGDDSDAFMVFSDRQFAGKSYTLNLVFNKAGFYIASPVYDESLYNAEIVFTLTSVSRSYYDWALYVWQRDNGIIGDLGDFGFAEPLAAYSNVSTGAGVVAARSFSTYTLSLKDFLKSQF